MLLYIAFIREIFSVIFENNSESNSTGNSSGVMINFLEPSMQGAAFISETVELFLEERKNDCQILKGELVMQIQNVENYFPNSDLSMRKYVKQQNRFNENLQEFRDAVLLILWSLQTYIELFVVAINQVIENKKEYSALINEFCNNSNDYKEFIYLGISCENLLIDMSAMLPDENDQRGASFIMTIYDAGNAKLTEIRGLLERWRNLSTIH